MDDRIMDAYYYRFNKTGVGEVDKVLSAVACAGTAYHLTVEWNEEARGYDDHTGGTPIEWIQNAAQEAADFIEAQAKRIKKLEAALQFYKDGFRYHAKRTSSGINLSEWKPTEELLNDCGETACAVLAGENK